MFQSIQDMIGDYIVQILVDYCQEAVSAVASAYAAVLIRQGTLQQDPVKERISILVNPNDPDDISNKPEWADSIVGRDDGWAAYEIGGGERWWRKFTIDINVYLVRTREERGLAREIGMFAFSAVHGTLQDHKAIDVTDFFGESAFLMLVDSSMPYESGGPPNTFIWRGKIRLKVLTEKP